MIKPVTSIKQIAFLAVFLLGSASAQAQSQEEIKPDKQIKGGLVGSRLINTEWESSPAPGFAIGLSLDFRFTRLFSVQPEVLYVEKGSRERVQVSSLDTEFNLVLDYVEVPVLAKFHLPADGLLLPHVYIGPYASFLIENNSNTEIFENEQQTPDELIGEARDSDFGIVAGIGTDLDFRFNTVSAEIRYSAGFTDVFGGAAPQPARNGTVMLLIGFQF
ncbi:porin family protein [Halalkalibaculum sp. DA3122]|uniref:porin family protein n=1 Tax=Halalkalibaculum sp. DA3122 TaxID=3373607 RepID=UPI0037548D12